MKKLYFKIVLFFRSLYLNFLLKRTTRLVAKADKAEQNMMSRLKGDPRYYQYLSDYTFRSVNKATKATTDLLPFLGKDPNYVPPPPAPPAPPPTYKPVDVDESKAAWVVDLKERPTRMAAVGSNDQWVKNPASNPVYQSRLAWEDKQRKAAEPQVTETTEVGGQSIEALRLAVTDIEAELSDKKPE